jgi:protein arginine kinase activator
MICNLCGSENATIYFKGVVHDQTVKLHLCDACAKKKGLVFPFGASTFSLGDMVHQLASAVNLNTQPSRVDCTACGTTYAEFQQTGQLGCGRCYATFAPVLGPLFRRIQGHDTHVGKIARQTVRVENPMQNLARLKVELQEAVKNEAYEQAAVLRDQIQTVEKQLKHV